MRVGLIQSKADENKTLMEGRTGFLPAFEPD